MSKRKSVKNLQVRDIEKIARKQQQKVTRRNTEPKYFDQQHSLTNIQNNLRLVIDQSLVNIGTGVGQQDRVGNKINVNRLQGKFGFKAATGKTSLIRFTVYVPRDITRRMSIDGIDVYDIIDTDTYTVLLDKYIMVSDSGPATRVYTFDKKFRGYGKVVDYTGGSSTSCIKNFMRLHVVSDSVAAADPTMTGNVKITFRDY